jgi:threonine dehydrogenase-like Zn-dependent dehydrogenase
MGREMKIAAITEPGRIEIRDVPSATPKPWQALVKMDACAICNGTDTKILHGHFPGMGRYPVIPGHESTGLVVEIGRDVKRYRVGDRVLRPAADPEGYVSMWGGYAEYGLAGDPEAFRAADPDGPPDWRWSMQQIVPDGVPADEATVLITLKETYSWLKRFEITPESRVLVLGGGPVSLSCVYWAKLFGAGLVTLAARREDARLRAKSFGADAPVDLSAEDLRAQAMDVTGGRGFDRIVDAVGASELINRVLPTLSPGGWIGVYGIADATPEGLGMISVPRGGDYQLRVFNPDEPGCHDEVTALVMSGEVDPSIFITHHLPLAEIEKGFDLVASRQAVKAVVQMGNG